jgi:hypothetical protein
MQIFRPFKEHEESAKFLDDRRLNKQIVEAYQLAQLSLRKLGLLPYEKLGYLNHPMSIYIYNEGKPYLPDLTSYMKKLNEEWIARGFKRGAEFQAKLDNLFRIVIDKPELFDWNIMPPYYVFEGDRIQGDEVYNKYQQLLERKWAQDVMPFKRTIAVSDKIYIRSAKDLALT